MSAAEPRFQEAASFFAIFAQSPWKACHVRTEAMEIFVTRDRDTPNPMTGNVPMGAALPAAPLRAPHLGTVVALAEIGTALVAGRPCARLELLGEQLEVLADADGVVAGHLLPIGALAEYDQPLLSLRAT